MTYNQIMYWQTQENRRKNITDEFINWLNYGVKSREQEETARHNAMDERLQGEKINVSWNELFERMRANRAGEEISWYNAKEQARTHQANEQISWFNAHENQRHNVQGENISWFNAYENKRANQANEQLRLGELQERIRSDLVNESISSRQADVSEFRATTEQKHYARQDAVAAQRQKLAENTMEYEKDIAYQKLDLDTRAQDVREQAERRMGAELKIDTQKYITDMYIHGVDKVWDNLSDSVNNIFKSLGNFKLWWS